MAISTEPRKTRRTEGVLTGGRSARVVESVLRATLEELSRVGYASLRVEDVAERSSVNKTTIYRRWPSKAELVAAAMASVNPVGDVAALETGDLREELIIAIRRIVAYAKSPIGRGLARLLQAERADPEIDKIARTTRARQRSERARLIERGIRRGELPPDSDPRFVSELIFSPVYSRVVTFVEPVHDALICEIVDTVLAGVRARAGLPRPALDDEAPPSAPAREAAPALVGGEVAPDVEGGGGGGGEGVEDDEDAGEGE